MTIPALLIISGLICAVLSAFTRVPLWVGVLLIGLGVLVGAVSV